MKTALGLRSQRRVCRGLVLLVACSWSVTDFHARIQAQELLSDPAFELSAPNGTFPDSGFWHPAYVGFAGAVCTGTSGRTRNGLWVYTGTRTNDWWSGPFQDLPASPGRAFRASAWLRTPAGEPWVSGTRARVHVSFLTSETNVLSSYESPVQTNANSSWSGFEVTTEAAPQGTAFIRFTCMLEKSSKRTGQSIVVFDDCSLVEVNAPGLRLSSRLVGIPVSRTQASFEILNTGNASLNWQISDPPLWLAVQPNNGVVSPGAVQTVLLTANRSGLSGPGTVKGTLLLSTAVGDSSVDVYLQVSPAPVPAQPSVVRCFGRQLRVQDRLPDGTLSAPYHYIIKGAAWSPASMDSNDDPAVRRAVYEKWYIPDIQLLRAMNANTVYVFLDFGAGPIAKAVLDYLYENGLKAIVTADDNGSGDTNRIQQIVPAYRDHPAILAWAIGNEWNINLFHAIKPGDPVSEQQLRDAAAKNESLAQQVKSLDTNHPIASIFGDIDASDGPLAMTNIVNHFCPTVDFWGVNAYRGPSFKTLFADWARIAKGPFFLSEYGTDAYRTVMIGLENYVLVSADGAYDEPMQADFVRGLWREIASNLSAAQLGNVCLGGTVFEWNDEWWKASAPPPLQKPDTVGRHDTLGFLTSGWNPEAMPDSTANEEWFGVVAIDRQPRLLYSYFQQDFASVEVPTDLDGDGLPDSWEYLIVDADSGDAIASIMDVRPHEDFDGDGIDNQKEYVADTNPAQAQSRLQITGITANQGVLTIVWTGGALATQYVERSTTLQNGGDWRPVFTNHPPTSVTAQYQESLAPSEAARFYRIQVAR